MSRSTSRSMSRRISVLFAAAALAVSSFAYAADPASNRDRAQQEKVQQEDAAQCEKTTQQDVQGSTPAPVVTLEEMFTAPAESESIETEDGVSAVVGPIEVVVSRIGPDGKPVMACVDTLKAARHFFDAPIEQLPLKKAKEQ